jgi:hypothetical protein
VRSSSAIRKPVCPSMAEMHTLRDISSLKFVRVGSMGNNSL